MMVASRCHVLVPYVVHNLSSMITIFVVQAIIIIIRQLFSNAIA
jgi:hypothetical protein